MCLSLTLWLSPWFSTTCLCLKKITWAAWKRWAVLDEMDPFAHHDNSVIRLRGMWLNNNCITWDIMRGSVDYMLHHHIWKTVCSSFNWTNGRIFKFMWRRSKDLKHVTHTETEVLNGRFRASRVICPISLQKSIARLENIHVQITDFSSICAVFGGFYCSITLLSMRGLCYISEFSKLKFLTHQSSQRPYVLLLHI